MLVSQYIANGNCLKITDKSEVTLVKKIVANVINNSYKYTDLSNIAKRLQYIFNSALQEQILTNFGGLIKRSNAFWSLDDSYEYGTDFQSWNGKKVEAKIYLNFEKMLEFAEKGTKDYTVFHGADYVVCYLVNGHFSDYKETPVKYWWWLKKTPQGYQVFKDTNLDAITESLGRLPISICTYTTNDQFYFYER